MFGEEPQSCVHNCHKIILIVTCNYYDCFVIQLRCGFNDSLKNSLSYSYGCG